MVVVVLAVGVAVAVAVEARMIANLENGNADKFVFALGEK